MYTKYRKFLLILTIFLAVGCDSGCIDSTDLGDESEVDQLYVNATSNVCSYTNGYKYSDTIQSSDIKTCLETSYLKRDVGVSDNLLKYLVPDSYSYVDPNNSGNKIDVKDDYDVCSIYDNYAGADGINGKIKFNNGVEGATRTSVVNGIYESCVKYCYAKCINKYGLSSSSIRTTVGGWVKNYVKSNDNYYGISINNSSRIKVTATGNISLSGMDLNKTIIFSEPNYGLDDSSLNGKINNYLSAGSTGSLYLKFNISGNNSNSSNLEQYTNAINELRKRYVKINKYDVELEENQSPDFSKLTCEYTTNNNEVSYVAEMKYACEPSSANNDCGNTSLYNALNENYSLNKLNLDVFSNDNFYNYSSNGFNNVEYDEVNNKYIYNKSDDKYKLQTEGSKGYILNYNSNVDGYVWSNSGTASGQNSEYFYTISIKNPNKIAFKSVKNDINSNKCNYEISYTDNTIDRTNTNPIKYKLELTDNNWHTLKNGIKDAKGNEKEVIINQFSSAYGNKNTNLSVYIKTTDKNCAEKLFIKLLPIKEFKIDRSGYAFFHIPQYVNNNSIKYNIANVNVSELTINSTNIENIYNNFYEYNSSTNGGSKSTDFYFNSINLTNNLSNLNKSYNENGFYVRKGQILRLDYSNWLSLDNQATITKKVWSNGKTGFDIDYGLGLMLPIKERPAYICSGTGSEDIDNVQLLCSMKGGIYSNECSTNDNKVSCSETCSVDLAAKYSKCDFIDNYIEINNLYLTGSNKITKANGETKSLTETFKVISSNFGLDSIKSGTVEISGTPQIINGITRNYNEEQKMIDRYISKLKECAVVAKNDNLNFSTNSFYDDVNNLELIVSGSTASGKIIGKKDINDKIEEIAKILEAKKHTEKNDNNETIVYYEEAKIKATYDNDIKDNNGNVIKPQLLQCYNLEDYKGSMDYFKAVVSDCQEASSLNMKAYGLTECIDSSKNINIKLKTLGALKLNSFLHSQNGGLADNFEEENGKYKASVSFSNNSYVTIIPLDGEFSLREVSGLKTELSISSKEFNSNGSRLEVFLARNSLLGSELFDNSGNVQNSTKIKWLVKCGENNCENGLYKFNSSGKLVSSTTGSVGINLDSSADKSDNAVKDFLDSDSDARDLVMYFKIKDTNDKIEDNDGSYKVKIVNSGSTTNYVSNIFKILINEITSLMDGKSFSLAKNISGNGYMICDKNNGVSCYRYNKDTVKGNGEKCTDTNNCYMSCDILSTEEEYKTRCEYIYNNGGFLKMIYLHIITNTTYQFLLKLSLIAMMIFYGFSYFLGLSSFSQEDLVKKMIRIVIIYTLVSPFGWDIYNKYVVNFFKQGIDSLLYLVSSGFEVGTDSVIETYLQRGDFTDKNILFSSGYDNIKLIFSEAIFNKVLGLVFSSWYGPIYFYLVFSAIISYCVAFITAIIMYISAQVFLSIILAIGPLIFMFLFFEKTKKTFDNWLDMLISFSLQQIFIILTLSFFNSLIFIVIKHVFAYTVCWNNILSLTLFGSPLSLLSFWKVPSGSTAGSTLNLQAAAENGPGFYNIMLFYIIGTLMGKFISTMADMAQEFAGGIKASDFTKNLTGKVSGAGEFAKSIVSASFKQPLNVISNKIDAFNKRSGDEYDKKYNERENSIDNKDLPTENNEKEKEDMNFGKQIDNESKPEDK